MRITLDFTEKECERLREMLNATNRIRIEINTGAAEQIESILDKSEQVINIKSQ